MIALHIMYICFGLSALIVAALLAALSYHIIPLLKMHQDSVLIDNKLRLELGKNLDKVVIGRFVNPSDGSHGGWGPTN